MGNGKISPTMTQAEGPHVIANIEMLIHMNAIIAAVAAELGFDPLPAVTPTIPTMYCEITIPVPPQSRILRRPNFSISQKETGVEHTVVYQSQHCSSRARDWGWRQASRVLTEADLQAHPIIQRWTKRLREVLTIAESGNEDDKERVVDGTERLKEDDA